MAVQLYTGVPLIVGGVPALDAACCCGGDPGPTVCAGAASLAGCFSDLYASYPNSPGDNTAMYSYLSGFQFDIDVSGSFNFPCDAAPCDNVAAPFVVSHGGTNVWTYGETCSNGGSNYGWTANLLWGCGAPQPAGTCFWEFNMAIGRSTGSPLWGRGVIWRQTFTSQKVFSTTNESISFLSQAPTFGSPGCLYSGSSVSVAVH